MGGSKKSEQLQRMAEEPGRLVANSRFLGRVEVPLSETLSLKRGQHPSAHPHWTPLRNTTRACIFAANDRRWFPTAGPKEVAEQCPVTV